jgi:hypothetical protein
MMLGRRIVARVERKRNPGTAVSQTMFAPDFASLNPGYESSLRIRAPCGHLRHGGDAHIFG